MAHVNIGGVGGVLGDVHTVVLLRVVAAHRKCATPRIGAIRRFEDFVKGEFDCGSDNGEIRTGTAAHAFA